MTKIKVVLESDVYIEDNTSKYIVVSAAPGSGKTKVLTTKIEST